MFFGSNHDLVLTTIKLKLKMKCFTKSPCIQFNLVELKELKIVETFQTKIGGQISALCILDSDADTLVNSIKDLLFSIAEKVLGKQRRSIQAWVTQMRSWICATKDSS